MADTNETMETFDRQCQCAEYIRRSDIPAKIIVMECERCHAKYVLYPSGQISYDVPVGIPIA